VPVAAAPARVGTQRTQQSATIEHDRS
jgi:hypothetical protein